MDAWQASVYSNPAQQATVYPACSSAHFNGAV